MVDVITYARLMQKHRSKGYAPLRVCCWRGTALAPDSALSTTKPKAISATYGRDVSVLDVGRRRPRRVNLTFLAVKHSGCCKVVRGRRACGLEQLMYDDPRRGSGLTAALDLVLVQFG